MPDMNFKNVPTDVEGLRRLLDYLHSEENRQHDATIKPPGDYEVFYLEKLVANVPVEPSDPVKRYFITIGLRILSPSEENFKRFVDVLKEIYRK